MIKKIALIIPVICISLATAMKEDTKQEPIESISSMHPYFSADGKQIIIECKNGDRDEPKIKWWAYDLKNPELRAPQKYGQLITYAQDSSVARNTHCGFTHSIDMSGSEPLICTLHTTGILEEEEWNENVRFRGDEYSVKNVLRHGEHYVQFEHRSIPKIITQKIFAKKYTWATHVAGLCALIRAEKKHTGICHLYDVQAEKLLNVYKKVEACLFGDSGDPYLYLLQQNDDHTKSIMQRNEGGIRFPIIKDLDPSTSCFALSPAPHYPTDSLVATGQTKYSTKAYDATVLIWDRRFPKYARRTIRMPRKKVHEEIRVDEEKEVPVAPIKEEPALPSSEIPKSSENRFWCSLS